MEKTSCRMNLKYGLLMEENGSHVFLCEVFTLDNEAAFGENEGPASSSLQHLGKDAPFHPCVRTVSLSAFASSPPLPSSKSLQWTHWPFLGSFRALSRDPLSLFPFSFPSFSHSTNLLWSLFWPT